MTARNVKYWLVTWTTFGTWLPGDRRGFQTWRGREYVPPPRRYAKPGEPVYGPAAYAGRRRDAARSLTQAPVTLSPGQIVTAADAIAADCDPAGVVAAALAVGPHHVHLLARFGPRPIRRVAGRLKTAATRGLHDGGFAPPRVWCRNEHLKSKPVGKPFEDPFAYVAKHVREGARVIVWPRFCENVFGLPDDVRGRLVAFPPAPHESAGDLAPAATMNRRLGGCEGHGDLRGSQRVRPNRTPR